jgi:hypothetical protein
VENGVEALTVPPLEEESESQAVRRSTTTVARKQNHIVDVLIELVLSCSIILMRIQKRHSRG